MGAQPPADGLSQAEPSSTVSALTGFDPSRLSELAERCEQAAGPDRGLDQDLFCVLGLASVTDGIQDAYRAPTYTASLDAAMTLLPKTAINHSLSSFYGHRNPAWGQTAWCFLFHDTAQLMGKRAAKEQIARMQKDWAFGERLHGPPRVALEKAIAEHFIEFFCRGAATPALALCAAALRALASAIEARSDATPKSGAAKGESATRQGDAQ